MWKANYCEQLVNQENANQNHNKISFYIQEDGYYKKIENNKC